MDISRDGGIFERMNNLEILAKNHVRSYGRHSCGFYLPNRLFGGQTIGQSCLAFKKLFPDLKIIKTETNFVSAGNATDPLDFFVDLKTVENGFSKMDIKQNGKIIAFSNLRFTKKTDNFMCHVKHSKFPDSVEDPETYEPIIREEDSNPSNDDNGPDQVLFEIRPIDPGKFLFYEDAFETARTWARINPKLKRSPKTDPLFVPMVLTDFFIFHPSLAVFIRYDLANETKNGASLNHKITVHCDAADINPNGYFLFQTSCNTISRQCSIIDGQLYDEKRRLIISYRQQNYTHP